MRFTSDELMFLTAMTKGPTPFGVYFDKVKKQDAAEKAKNAKEELIKKGILTEDSITKKGFAVVKVWEDYRNAYRFMVIKNSIIGLITNRRCVVIYRDKAGFEIVSGDRTEILYSCLKEYSSLRRADKKDNVTYVNANVDYEEFRTRVKDFNNNILTVGVFSGDRNYGQERFFYWDDEHIFSYDPHEQIEKTMEPSEVRAFIMDGLEINKEVLANG